MLRRFVLEAGDSLGERGRAAQELSIERLDGTRVRMTRGDRTRTFDVRRLSVAGRTATWSLLPEEGGPAITVDVEGPGPELTVTLGGISVPLTLTDARRTLPASVAARAQESGPATLRSPMPGKVVKILVAEGAEVKAGQGLVVVEAMKMENELKSPRDGVVRKLHVKEGQAVETSAALVVVEG